MASNLFTNLLPTLPILLVWLVGIILAIVNWGKYPRVSLVALIGLGLLLLLTFTGTAISALLPFLMQRPGTSAPGIANIWGIFNIVLGLLRAGAWVLILVAIFGWRNERAAD